MVRTPDGTDALELVKFHEPPAEADQGMFLLCYVRGPEGLIIELAERLRSGST